MDKNEILEKSRKENNNKDLYELKIINDSYRYSIIVMVLLALAIMMINLFWGDGRSSEYSAIVFSTLATSHIYKYVKLKNKTDIALGITYIAIVVMNFATYIFNLVS